MPTHRMLLQVLAAAFVALSAKQALAQSSGPYASVFLGPAWSEDADLSVHLPGPPYTLDGKMHFDTGWMGGIAAGYGWSNGAAVEGEVSYRRTGLDQETIVGNPAPIGLDGRISNIAVMINGYYRFENTSAFTPYVGAGVGAAFLDVAALAEGSGGNWFRDSDVQFAYQGIAGVSYAITPELKIGAEYRYFGTSTPSFTDNPGGGAAVTSEIDNRNHSVLLRLTRSFGQAAASP